MINQGDRHKVVLVGLPTDLSDQSMWSTKVIVKHKKTLEGEGGGEGLNNVLKYFLHLVFNISLQGLNILR